MTNAEFIKAADPEQLAKFLNRYFELRYCASCNTEEWRKCHGIHPHGKKTRTARRLDCVKVFLNTEYEKPLTTDQFLNKMEELKCR